MSTTPFLPAYIPAVLRENVDWYIEYSFINNEGRLQRVRTKLNRILKRFRTKAEKRQYALNEVARINSKLLSGWTPETDKIFSKNTYAGTSWSEVSAHYLSYLLKGESSRELSHSTVLNYRNKFSIFSSFVDSLDESKMRYIYQLNEDLVRDFFNWASCVRHVGKETLTNYRRMLHSFCEWCVSCGYMTENPVANIKLLSNSHRRRAEIESIKSKYIDEQTRKKIFTWLDANDKNLKLAVLLCHICFLRPKEIAMLQVCHIHLHDSLIFVPKEISKNKTDAYVTLPDEVAQLLLELKILSFPSHYYIFNRQLIPEEREKPCRGDEIRERWRSMCKSLHIPDSVHLYHMKHTGITDMTEKMPEKLVQLQARHHSIEMTERYVQPKAPKAVEAIKHYDI